MSETPGQIKRPSPMIGEHGEDILTELGYDKEEIESLIADNVISIEKLK